jgi:Family of unknown function (DUF6350)
VSGHGPDAEGILNGDRDWTVPIAASLFTAAYVVVASLVGVLSATPATDPAIPRALLGAMILALCLGGTGIAVGSGRAAIWAAWAPEMLRVVLAGCRRIVVGYLVVCLLALVGALVTEFSTAATIVSRLQADTGDTILFVLATALIAPNAIAFSGSYLLGPGFAVGTETIVAPSAVVLGPLPLFPLVAALPEERVGIWVARIIVLIPVLVAAWGVVKNHRRHPTTAWFDGIVRGGVSGVLAGVVVAVFAGLSGGAIGPGRMRQVSPFVFDVLTHGIAYFGIGGLLGGAVMTWWYRRGAQPRVVASRP